MFDLNLIDDLQWVIVSEYKILVQLSLLPAHETAPRIWADSL